MLPGSGWVACVGKSPISPANTLREVRSAAVSPPRLQTALGPELCSVAERESPLLPQLLINRRGFPTPGEEKSLKPFPRRGSKGKRRETLPTLPCQSAVKF